MPHRKHELVPFPGRPHPDIVVTAEALRPADNLLRLTFVITGEVSDVLVPAPIAPARKDGLWESTCCEAFVKPAGGAGYGEINLSPSTEWAAYGFTGYREGGHDLDIATPDNSFAMADGTMMLAAELALPALAGGPWRVGLSAVIEDRAGGKSYWALAHAPEKPDFHDETCFVLDLPAPDEA